MVNVLNISQLKRMAKVLQLRVIVMKTEFEFECILSQRE